MRRLNTYLNESLLKNIGVGSEAFKNKIREDAQRIYGADNVKVILKNGKFIVDADTLDVPEDSQIENLQPKNWDWGNVTHIRIAYNKYIKNLVGCPRESITGDLIIEGCRNLESLKGAPKIVFGYISVNGCDLKEFDCADTYCSVFKLHNDRTLKDMENCPLAKSYYFWRCTALKNFKGMDHNKDTKWGDVRWIENGMGGLETLEGCPKKVGSLILRGAEELKSLKGAPKIVEGIFDISFCRSLKSLKGAPESCKQFKYEGIPATKDNTKEILNLSLKYNEGKSK